jgi:hypothetical protein
MHLRIASLAVALTVLLPAAASAAPAPFRDRVLSGAKDKLGATTRQATNTMAVPTKEGYSVSVSFTAAVPPDPALAASYVNYLDGLPHGTELAKLKILIADTSEVGTLCGGTPDEGILACYGGEDQTMIVPSSGLATTFPGTPYTAAYALTHEYGHHIAANRNNQGFDAIDYGPKYWASYELVCDKAINGLLFPGDEGDHYLDNPGESWAETYARLTFPDQPWTFSAVLVPDATALAAARTDVLQPWTKDKVVNFRLTPSRRTASFSVALHLDGTLKATATGPKGSKVGLKVTSGSQRIVERKATKSRAAWSLASGCREKQTETLSFRVTRAVGAGTVKLRVSYPG